MRDLLLVVAGGLVSLGALVLGALLKPLTQLYFERKREQRALDRAKLLIAGELLHAEVILSTASIGMHWPFVEDVNGFLPTSAWRENRSSLAGRVDDELWNQLVMAYAVLEDNRSRFVLARRLPPRSSLSAREAEALKDASNNLGRLRKKLGGSDVVLNASEANPESKPRMDGSKDDFQKWLDGLSTDDLKKNAVITKVNQLARDLAEMKLNKPGARPISTTTQDPKARVAGSKPVWELHATSKLRK